MIRPRAGHHRASQGYAHHSNQEEHPVVPGNLLGEEGHQEAHQQIEAGAQGHGQRDLGGVKAKVPQDEGHQNGEVELPKVDERQPGDQIDEGKVPEQVQIEEGDHLGQEGHARGILILLGRLLRHLPGIVVLLTPTAQLSLQIRLHPLSPEVVGPQEALLLRLGALLADGAVQALGLLQVLGARNSAKAQASRAKGQPRAIPAIVGPREHGGSWFADLVAGPLDIVLLAQVLAGEDAARLPFLLPGTVGAQPRLRQSAGLLIRRNMRGALGGRWLHVIPHRLVDQSADEGVQGDGPKQERGALDAIDGQHEGHQMRQEDGPQARDGPREARRLASLLLEVRVDGQRGGGHTDAHAEAKEQGVGHHVAQEGLTEGGQHDAAGDEQGPGHGHLPEGEPPEHGPVQQACAGRYGRISVDNGRDLGTGHAQAAQAILEQEAKLLQAGIGGELRISE